MTQLKRIAVIDDDVMITKAATYLLNDDYESYIFENGDAFMKKFLSGNTPTPDLILLDLMMPGSDGLTILNQIKENPDLKKVPVIIVSARSSASDKAQLAVAGAADYVSKPYDFDELKKKIDYIFSSLYSFYVS